MGKPKNQQKQLEQQVDVMKETQKQHAIAIFERLVESFHRIDFLAGKRPSYTLKECGAAAKFQSMPQDMESEILQTKGQLLVFQGGLCEISEGVKRELEEAMNKHEPSLSEDSLRLKKLWDQLLRGETPVIFAQTYELGDINQMVVKIQREQREVDAMEDSVSKGENIPN